MSATKAITSFQNLYLNQGLDQYGFKKLEEYRRSPKLDFLGARDSRLLSSKPVVTARLRHLPVVPLSKPFVVSTRTSPVAQENKEDNKRDESNFNNENKVQRFTMSQSWPITCNITNSSAQGILKG